MSKSLKNIFIFFMAFYGLITFFISTATLFNWFGIGDRHGDFVPLVVWANWVCSLLILASAYGLIAHKKWPPPVLFVAVALLIIAYGIFWIRVLAGKPYEVRTIIALPLRTIVTLFFTWVAYKIVHGKAKEQEKISM